MNFIKVNAGLFTIVLFVAMPARSPAQQKPSEIGQQDAPKVRAFIAQLQNPNAEVRSQAAQSLRNMKKRHLGGQVIKDAVSALSKALSSGSSTTFDAAAALESFGREANEAVPALEKALATRDDHLFYKQFYKHHLATVLVVVSGGNSKPANEFLKQFEKNQRLIEAVWKGDLDQVRRQLTDGAEVNSRYFDFSAFLEAGRSDYTALMSASLLGNEEVVKLLIEAKADLNLTREGETSLYMAVTAEKDAMVNLLVKAGAKGDPKQIRLTRELFAAACRGFKIRPGEGYPLYPGVVGELQGAPAKGRLLEIKPGATYPKRAENPKNTRLIMEVLKRGVDVNATDPLGHTALMYAANLGLVENVKVLLARGADATLKTKYGATALSFMEEDSSVARAERRQVAVILKAHLAKKK